MMRLFNFIKIYYLNLIIILSNIFYLKKLIISVLCKINIILVAKTISKRLKEDGIIPLELGD